MSAAPQSGEDVDSVVRELRLLDALLDVRWNPLAVMTKRGGYDAMGRIIDPEYRGLWRIIRNDGFTTQTYRPFTHICYVTKPVDIGGGMKAMVQDGEYAPLGAWLVEFMRQSDKHNLEEARKLSAFLDRQNQAYDDAQADGDAGAIEEAASRLYHAGTAAGGGVSEFHPVNISLEE